MNTIESFKNCDKAELLKNEGRRLLDSIKNGSCLQDPTKLVTFSLLTFSVSLNFNVSIDIFKFKKKCLLFQDLKKYNFYYWFAFPAAIDLVLYETSQSELLCSKFDDKVIEKFSSNYYSLDSNLASFFVANKSLDIILLKDAIHHDNIDDNLINYDIPTSYFCFSDPSEYEQPGWMLRNFVLLLYKLCPILHGQNINILAVRQNQKSSLESSRLFYVKLPASQNISDDDIKWTGWEKNNQGKLLPRVANMSEVMDPMKTAEHFAMLNLKLMKWRLLPCLDLDIIKKQKCLLFGAGTLGCGIARNLMSWGFSHITFVDSGHVSFSNPVRQSLFTYSDASQNKFKAEAASARLQEILPCVVSI